MKSIKLRYCHNMLSIDISSVPESVKEVGLEFEISPEKLWSLDLPTHRFTIDKLIWSLEAPFWPLENKLFQLRPIDVAKFPKKHLEQFQKVLRSDLTYPIEVIFYKKRWLILDGLHRLLKTFILESESIDVKIISIEHLHKVIDLDMTYPGFDWNVWFEQEFHNFKHENENEGS